MSRTWLGRLAAALVVSTAFTLPAADARGETVVQGMIPGGVWTPAGNPYLAMGLVYCTGDLTIEAGTVVRFGAANGNRGTLKTVEALVVNGTDANPVVLEAIDPQATAPTTRWSGVTGDGPMTVTGAIFRGASTCLAADGAGPVSVRGVRFEACRLGMHVGVGQPVMDRITAVGCETGIQLHGSGNQTITNSVFVQNTRQGVDAGVSTAIFNATFDRNRAALYRFFSVGLVVRNSILSNNDIAFEDQSSTSLFTFTNSGLWANANEYVHDDTTTVDTFPGNTIIRADPRYVSATDLHLTAQSPFIDVGVAAGAPDHDFDLVSRPRGAGFDLGAYEFVAGTGTGGAGGGATAGAGGTAGGQGGTGGASTGVDAAADVPAGQGGRGSGGSAATGGTGGARPADAGQDHKAAASGGGCGCRLATGAPGGPWWLVALAAAAGVRRSRRRRLT